MYKPIQYSTLFAKHYRKQITPYTKINKQVIRRIKQFLTDPKLVKDPTLVGAKLGLRLFSVSGDIRIVYQDLGDRYFFLDIGTHNQVY
ncbi:MAG TPA: hypothetical protein VJC17_01405 [Candidatus Dojkabacteria bacterium]|nr:hypothetical protein [Candidatus Dojkabacteria bacterium]